jgi:hypothetical protein
MPTPYPNAVSADGRFVVFKSKIASLVANDTNGVDDIYVRDRVANTLTRVSVSSSGAQANGMSDYPSISADGRFVVFGSQASNLVADDANGIVWDVFVHDLVAHTTSLVSRTSADGPVDNNNTVAVISAGGRYVAFLTASYTLDPRVTDNVQLFMRDLDFDGNGVFDEPGNSRTTLISVADDGTPAQYGLYPFIDITPDGRYVAFSSYASNLVPNDTNGMGDVFVRDLQANHTWRASVASDGTQAPADTYSFAPSISADGRFVVFVSNAATLVAGDTNGKYDIFLHDAQTSETTRVSVSSSNQQGDLESGGAALDVGFPSISDDGRYVAFQSKATNFGGSANRSNVYVRDRELETTTAVNRGTNGSFLVDATMPVISGDGGSVMFRVGNLNPYNPVGNLYAASDFYVTPTTVEVTLAGGEQSATVTAPGRGWTATASPSWITVTDGANRGGSGTLHFTVASATGSTVRTGTVTVSTPGANSKTITVVQSPGFTLQSVSPTSGSASGGATIVLNGSRFVAGTSVLLDGQPIASTLINSTTLYVVTPWHYPGVVDVTVRNPDGETRTLTGGYRFVDTTPPVISSTLNGAVYGNNGWIINTPVITWTVTDAESSVTSSNCNPITVYNDTYGWTQYGCNATSAGGTITGWTEKLYRDTYPPTVTLNSPSAALYTPGQAVTANYTCTDSSSKIATCVATKPSGAAVDTAAPGFYDFTITATDNAGWSKAAKVTYGVTSGVCTPMPSDIVSWWTGDNTLNDLIGSNHGTMIGSWPYSPYDPGFVGPSSLIHTGYIGYNFGHDPSLKMTTAFTVGAWIYAKNVGYRDGTLISKKGEFGLELYLGSLLYTFGSAYSKSANFEVKYDTWTHVAMTYDAGALTIYANGRPVATETVAPTLVDAVPGTDDFVVGAGQGVTWPFKTGSIDDVQLYRRALAPAELASIYLSGRSGLCAPAASALTASATSATYGSDATTTLSAQLTANGAGVAGRTVAFSIAGTSAGTAVTDNDGNASLAVSLAGKNAGTYAISAAHGGDSSYTGSTATTSLTLAKRPTTIVWATPAPITYGTSLSSSILNATLTETVSGTFVYTPNASIPPPNAGTLTLNVTFTPSSTLNYLPATKSVTLEVLPSTPTITLTGGTFTYDKQTHAATVSATGAGGVVPTVTYNGSSTLPRDAGEYAVVASIEATQNYSAASATATITILKATPTITLNVGAGTFTYDKQTHAATVSATGVGGEALTPTLTYNGSSTVPLDAGEYAVAATLEATQNYNAASATATITILKATPTITLTGGGTFVYDKQTHAATVSATGVGGETLTPALTYNGSSTVPLDAGDYAVSATLDATQNYNAANATATITILKATPTMTVGAYQTFFWYDGQPHSGVAFARGIGGEDLTPVTLTYNGATEPPVNAGLHTLLATYEGSTNYHAATKTGTLEIRKTTVSMHGGISNFPTYDGTPKTISSASATGVGGEQLPVTVTYNGSSTAPIDAGSYTVTIIFEGSQNYEPHSLTLSSQFTIAKAYITITLSGGPSYITYDGNPHGATATATGIFGEDLTPAVTVTYNGGSTAPLNAGTYTILASYPGTANYAPRSTGRTLTITKVNSSMSWGAPQPMVYGQALGPAQLKATASSPGTFTYSPAAGTVPHRGSVPLQGTFVPADPTNYAGGTINTTVAVSPAPLTVKANDAVKAFGAPLPAFTASFIGFVNGDTPASLAGSLGFSTTATDQSAPGTYPISVGGVASNDYTISFLPGVLTVQPIATSVAVSSSANPSGVNQPVTFTASVTTSGAGQPTGTVTFLDGATVLGTAAVQNGTASLTTILATGTHAITTTYSGDATFAASSSAALTQTVNASSTSTTATVTSSRNPSKTGQSVTLTGRVTSPAGTPAGTIEFLDGGVVIGTATLSGGQATLTTTALPVGSHAITVRYLGSATMPPSLSATLVQVVNTSSTTVKSTTTTLTASPSTGSYGTQTTFSVSVAPPMFNSAPTGNVVFTIDGVSSTVVALTTSNGKGVATLSTSTLPRGKHLVTVTYMGSGTYAGSTATLTYTVN